MNISNDFYDLLKKCKDIPISESLSKLEKCHTCKHSKEDTNLIPTGIFNSLFNTHPNKERILLDLLCSNPKCLFKDFDSYPRCWQTTESTCQNNKHYEPKEI